MARIQRRRRVACRLKCEIVPFGHRPVRGRVVSVSEGGLAVIADLDLQQGDPIQLMIEPGSGAPAKVAGTIGNDVSASPSGRSSRIRKFGCVVSEPTASFRELFDALAPRLAEPRPVAMPLTRPRAVDPAGIDPDLPLSREFLPPPKVEPEESLPCFKVRLKQIGGPRTRTLTLPARSATQAKRIALDELARIEPAGSEGWRILHIRRP